ncbi:MAG: DNA-binding transcriptional regulator [Patescibacteria group bacterium]|nr:DNA-binding transcriptional regulator [Patescibacteria group bacterium]
MPSRDATKVRRKVAIAYPLAVPHMTIFLRGVMDYAQEHGGWSLTTSPPSLIGAGEKALTLADLRGWPGDGVFAAVLNQTDIRMARRLRIPVLNGASTLRDTGIPRVRPDHYAMGRLAAEHLLGRGFQRLAYYGLQGFWFSEERCRGFAERAQQAGATCDVLQVPQDRGQWASWQKRTELLVRWLEHLQRPVGILAVQDYRARVLMEECGRLGLHIPHEVAVIGMEDDPTLCEFCRPTLSSVARDSWRLGFETAAALDRLMDGLPVPDDLPVASAGVVARQSTDTIAFEDPDLAAVLHFIHDHLSEPFGIDRLVKATSISRRKLEIRFQQMLGCTPYEYLNQKRIERAKQLLIAPDRLKFHGVVRACGFSSVAQMRLSFKRVTGMTPLEYRQSERARETGTG